MRIGFDAKRALNNSSGLGNYSRNLLNALMRDYADNDYLLFTPKAGDEYLNQLEGNFKLVFPESKHQRIVHPGQSMGAFNAVIQPYIFFKKIGLWRSWGIVTDLISERISIYHGLSNEIPIGINNRGIASVVTIHDLLFLKDKQQYPLFDRMMYKTKTQYAVKNADRIIAVSAETKRDIVHYYGTDEKKIVVIPPVIDEKYQRTKSKEQRAKTIQKYKLPEKYILNVSSFFPRKNQKTLIEAFDLIKDKVEEHLVLAGGAGNTLPDIKVLIAAHQLQQRVHILTNISNTDLPAVYQAASLFVFPALYEGFGMPVAEAMLSGTPVITTPGGAMQEAGGDAALYTDPLSANELANAMLKVLSDEKLRTGMVAHGLIQAQQFTGKVVAANTMQVYNSLL